jgi:hypothetical protein
MFERVKTLVCREYIAIVNHSALKDGASFVLANALALRRSSVTTPILYSLLTIDLTLL